MSETTDRWGQRAAAPDELCTCGRQAMTVYVGGDWGPTGHCGLSDGGLPASGVCTFCGDTVDHDHYARAEQAAGRPYLAYGTSGAPQGGRCPLYRLRLADPLPELHAASVRRFDPAADRRERAQGRLRADLVETLLAAGADYDGQYRLLPSPEDTDPPTGDLADAVDDVVWCVQRALAADDEPLDSHDANAGEKAVTVLFVMLADLLTRVGADPNPLAGLLGAEQLIERAGGPQAWLDTPAHDRPLLITRRVARRPLDSEVPHDIYRPWFT